MELVNKGHTDEVQGVIFILDGYRFTGSKVDRKYSYSKLNRQIEFNNTKQQREINTRLAADKGEAAKRKAYSHNHLGRLTSPTRSAAANSRNAEYEVGSNENYDEEPRRKRGLSY